MERKFPYAIECEIRLPDYSDLTGAQFEVGGRPFENLPLKPTHYSEENIKVTPEALMMTHSIAIPYKINQQAKSGFEAVLQSTYDNVSRQTKSGSGLACCTPPSVDASVHTELH